MKFTELQTHQTVFRSEHQLLFTAALNVLLLGPIGPVQASGQIWEFKWFTSLMSALQSFNQEVTVNKHRGSVAPLVSVRPVRLL